MSRAELDATRATGLFETVDAIVEAVLSLKGKLPQLHKLAEVAASRGKRPDVIYGPRTRPGTIRAFKESLRKTHGLRVRFIRHIYFRILLDQ